MNKNAEKTICAMLSTTMFVFIGLTIQALTDVSIEQQFLVLLIMLAIRNQLNN